MSIRLIILFVCALSTAGLTAILAKNWLANERAEILSSVPKMSFTEEKKIEILVAKHDLVPGSFVLKEKLMWQEWPEDALNERMLQKGNVDMEHFAGSVVRSRIPAGQPLLPSAVVSPGQRGFLAAVLAPGMRAVTVPISASSGVGGFIFPGDQVDLLVTIKLKPIGEDKENKPDIDFTQTLLENVRVLGKDQVAEQQEGEAKVAKTVTLEVSPKQAEMIALSNTIGKMSLALRSLAKEEELISELDQAVPPKSPTHSPSPVAFIQGGGEQDVSPKKSALSLTTDYDVNYLFQQWGHRYGDGSSKSNSSGNSVEVFRGSDKQTKKF